MGPCRAPEVAESDLRTPPIFHHTRESIKAHLTIVFAALAMARYLQNQRIVRTLLPLQQVTMRIAGHHHLAQDPLTPAAQASSTPSTSPLNDVPRWHESGQRPTPYDGALDGAGAAV